MKIFAERLQSIARERDLTQKDLAQLCGVSQGAMSSYLRGEKLPLISTACEIAAALGVSVAWLCGESMPDIQPRTYAQLIEQILLMVDVAHIVVETDRPPMTEARYENIALVSVDPVIVSFFKDYHRVKALYLDGTIDQEMYDAWIEKRLRQYENAPLTDVGIPD